MSEKMRESLSALLDDEANELEVERVLANIAKDGELRAAWTRYNLARSVAVGQTPACPQFDISAQVRSAIEDNGSNFSSMKQRFLRPLASVAVAASVAATVVLGGQQLAQLDPHTQDNQAVASSASPVGLVNSLGATSVMASLGSRGESELHPMTRTAYQRLAEKQLQRHMQEHAEHAALNSPQGLVPYARVPLIQQ